MTTHDDAGLAGPATTAPVIPPPRPGRRAAPNWWHRGHPVFTPLSGFFTGLVVVILVPGTFGALLSWLFEDEMAERLFPFSAVIFAVPVALLAVPRTRRFGKYMLVGMLVTAVVVLAVAALTIWILVNNDA
ncbi:MAG: hypothetical protein WB767_05465 [Nocardioides sp.]